MKSKQANITLVAGEEEKLQALAEKWQTVCRYGSASGRITWRELIHQIAWGQIDLCKPGQSTGYEKKGGKSRKGDKTQAWKAWPKYPPKWWTPDGFGEVPIADCVAASKRTEDELIAGGLEIMPGTRNFVGPDEWMRLAPELPDEPPHHNGDNA